MLAAALSLLMGLVCSCNPSLENTTLELSVGSADDVLEYTFDRQTASIRINCNRTWKAVSSQPWLVVETPHGSAADNQAVQFRLYANPGYAYRQAALTITAGKASMVLNVNQAPDIVYLINENFDRPNLFVELEVPEGWYGDGTSALDKDGDGIGWRCWRDPATDLTYVYSCSFREDLYRAYRPDNWLVSPVCDIPVEGFSLRWDSKGSDPEYLHDKYQVYVVSFDDGVLQPIQLLYEEDITNADQLLSHCFSLDAYVGQKIRIAFRHYDSYDLAWVLITNVEVSNRQ